ncbi:M13 family metallopeptidase [Adhaeribacter sp. BT258]|uniref:M13 family metallopeptidase n=2 Tax=Adhaeribacter terrigena TaxID=2793070 RepID=A0ABS1C5T6_9BACT|nr:M13 family metallopeptidase [Adhaeribacter terrigena]
MLLTQCKAPEAQQQSSAKVIATPAPEMLAVAKGVGIDVPNIDKSVKPCDDFYLYANGNWIKNNPVPATESIWSSFNEVAERNNAILRQLLNNAAATTNAEKGSNLQKVGDYFYSGMDSAGIETAGLAPLKPELDRLNAVKDLKGLQNMLATHQMHGFGPMFGSYVGQDDKISTQYALFVFQGGIGLPDRDYYLKDDKRSKEIRTAYLNYLRNMFTLLGDSEKQAVANANKVMAIETRLAKASKSRVELRDPYANYNKMTVAEFQKLMPNLNVKNWLTNMKLGAAKEVIVGQPAFFKELNAMLKSVPVADWKTYMRLRMVSSLASALPNAYAQENFNFFSKTLSGAKQMQPRWKRMARATDNALGEALGQLYVEKTFSPEAKAKALTMIKNLQAAFQEHVKTLDWMSEETKQKAMQKLDAFAVKIGYPDQWKDYSTFDVNRGPYVMNVLRARMFDYNDMASKLGKPVDRNEWHMSPPTVNAYYNPSMNEIVFPAGILQPPFFDPKADDAVNYGGMGAVIGHELTHGFDDQGRQYDHEGNLKDWWTKEDAERFAKHTEMVDKQYSAYQPLDSVFVNGQLTMGENIADIGGLNIAFTALQKANAGKTDPKYDGFTQNQRFFLAWAQNWRINATDQYLRQQVMTDPHSPGKFRCNGPLANMPQFYEAFGCKEGDKMVRKPEERIRIW